jgi:catechol 2,3-dioxygenase-like lactoylglutathione lyase family enzyme
MMPEQENVSRTTAFFMGIVTERYFESWNFYTEVLGFTTWEESDSHVLLVHPSGARIELLQHETNEQHPELVSATDGRGLWFVLEVGDVDAEYQRQCAFGVPSLQPPAYSWHGRKAFMVRDPNGVLICVCDRFASDGNEDCPLPEVCAAD